MSGGGGSPSGQTQSTQNTAPWSGQQGFLLGTGPTGAGGSGGGAGNLGQYFSDGYTIPGTGVSLSNTATTPLSGVLPSAAALYSNYQPGYYPGSTVAPLNNAEVTNLNSLEGYANGGNPTINAAGGFNSSLLNGNYLNSNPAQALQYNMATGNFGSTPGMSDLVSMANGNYFDPRGDFATNLSKSIAGAVQPGMDAQFVDNPDNSNHQYSVDQAVASQMAPIEANMQGSAASTLAGIESGAATQYGGNYNNAMQQMVQGLFYAPQTAQLPVEQAQTGLAAGQSEQAQSQQELQAQIDRYNYGQMLPYNLLGEYNGLVGGNYGSSSTLTQPYYSASGGGLAGAGVGALSGAAAGSMFGPWGAAGGAVLGGLYGGLSDRRAKEDIVQVGKADNDLPIYLFRYKGDQTPHMGFMADEVEKLHPDAVNVGPLGLKFVDYDRAVA